MPGTTTKPGKVENVNPLASSRASRQIINLTTTAHRRKSSHLDVGSGKDLQDRRSSYSSGLSEKSARPNSGLSYFASNDNSDHTLNKPVFRNVRHSQIICNPEDDDIPSAWLVESTKLTMPTSLAPGFPLLSSLKTNYKEGKFSNSFNILRSKFRSHPSVVTPAKEESLEMICSKLSIGGSSGPKVKVDRFHPEGLELTIKLLNSSKFQLILPPSVDFGLRSIDSGLGDTEEQGDGGTCDKFISMLPESVRDISKKASPLGLVPKLLPHGIVSTEARYVGSCFWIWLCIVDDLTENLTGTKWDETEADLFRAFGDDPHNDSYFHTDSDAVQACLALRKVIDTTRIANCGKEDESKEYAWRQSFRLAVREVLTGFREERPLLSKKKIPMHEWMRLRIITISVRPFMILVRADLGINPTLSKFGDPLHKGYQQLIAGASPSKVDALTKVECHVQLITGLQNDILGWEKDSQTDNWLSAIQVLIQNGTAPHDAMAEVIETHNKLVTDCIGHAQTAWASSATISLGQESGNAFSQVKNHSRPSVFGVFRGPTMIQRRHSFRKDHIRKYLELILGFCNGMAMWMAVSKRYAA